MNLERRISELEDRIGVTDQAHPLIILMAKNCEKGSIDEGTPFYGIIPAPAIGTPGASLTRGETEDPDIFLKRCESKYAEIYP